MFAYIGCRTTKERNARGKGIEVYKVSDNTWTHVGTVPTLDNPSYLTLDRTEQFLYTVHGDFNEVSAFKVESDGMLTFINTVKATGKNPVYIVPNITNRFLFVATLQGGTVATLPILEDGSIGEAIHTQPLEGLSPDGVSHAHQCELDQSGNYLLVPTQGRHIGYERIWVFKVNNQDGSLTLVHTVTARSYAEPRHLVISKDNKRVYLINEKGNYVTYYNFDDTTGTLTPVQIVSSLPETYTGEGQASAVVLHPSEDFLYATNRIHESIATYRINKETGFISNIAWNETLGLTPRFATISTDGNALLVANEDSDTIRIFTINPQSGMLTYSGTTIETGSPTCIAFKTK